MTNLLNVLVVEDNVINQKVVVKMLERLQIHPSVAVNGKEAVRIISSQPYDIVFMDIQMPEMDGLEATRVIRAMESTGSHPIIIALTANAMIGDRERCLDAGMDDYLAKPVKQSDIESIILKWFPASTEPHGEVLLPVTESIPSKIDPKRIEQIQEIGDSGLLKELLMLYLEDLDQFSDGVTSAVSDENFKLIYEYSHKLKGSSANLGIESIREACISMETLARQNKKDDIARHIIVMQQLMSEIRMYITQTYL
ncbi:MAG: response regulator [Bacteriovoracaceae bacterium]